MAKIYYMDLDKNNQNYVRGDSWFVKNNMPANYVSFDGNGIDLEKSEGKSFLGYGDWDGFYSKVSDASCVVTKRVEEPDVKLSHSKGYFDFKKGITISFYNESCAEFKVEYKYKNSLGEFSETITYQVTEDNFYFIPPNFETEINGKLEKGQVSSMEFYFTKSKIPYQAIKMEYIKFGKIIIFEKLKNISVLEEINVLSDDLPINQLDFSVISKDFSDFKSGDAINVINHGRYYGTFYLEEAERSAAQIYDITAFNSIKVLDKTQYKEWFSGIEFYQFRDQIAAITGFEIFDFDQDSSVGKAFGHIPIDSCRFALCQHAFANRKMIDGSRSDTVTMLSIPTEISSVILTKDKRIIGEAKFSKTKPITAAKTQYESSFNISSEYESIKLKNNANKRTVHFFEEPMKLADKQPSDITIFSHSENYVDFKSTKADASINVFKIEHFYNNVTLQNDSAGDSNSNEKDFSKLNLRMFGFDEDSNEIQLTDLKAADIKKYMKSGGVVKAKIVLQGEKVGDLIQIETAYDGIKTGIITSMNIAFGFKDVAEIEVLEWKNG